jgi:glucose-6-phosphate 1-dehydrogenase
MAKVFRALRPPDPDRVVLGQYEGYRDEAGVDGASAVETFVAMEVFVDDWTWIGVPFLLRTGKALAESRRTITIGFKEPPLKVFPGDVDDSCNELVLELTDDPRIFADVRAKVPGPDFVLGRGRMRLDLLDAFPEAQPLEAYERLLLDVLRGQLTLFMRGDELEAAWEWVEPILAYWEQNDSSPIPYSAGTWGPAAASALIGRDGLQWREEALPED